MFYGPIPDGLMVCHTCDVRHCVNPHHLYLGTADDNNKDARDRGKWRTPWVADEQRRAEVIRLWRTGEYLQREVGELVGYSQAHVSRIIREDNARRLLDAPDKEA